MVFPYKISQFESDHRIVDHCARLDFIEDVIDETVFGFPYSSIVFDYKGCILTMKKRKYNVPKIYLHSPRIEPLKYSKAKGGTFIIFRFQPSATSKITKLNIQKLNQKNFLINLENDFIDLHEDFRYEKDAELLTNKFLERISSKYQFDLIPIDNIIKEIIAKKGNLSVKKIVEENDQSIRTLNRQFRKIIGMKLNDYLRLVKFSNFTNALKNPNCTLEDLFEEYNYYNYSNFKEDFKKITGMWPHEYNKPSLFLLHDLITSSY